MPRWKRFGETWWGERWIESLEALGRVWSNRLPRGRGYARRGHVVGLDIEPGRISARVTGSRSTPYRIEIGLRALSDEQWARAVEALAGEAGFAARLVAGEMPPEIDRAFEQAGADLFPSSEAELETDCSCPDWANPCKHIAAVHYVLAEAFDRDPFLLFEIRGRGRDDMLEAVRRARAGEPADGDATAAGEEHSAGVYSDADADFYRARGALDDVHFHIAAPERPLALLRRLGAPPSWSADEPPSEFLVPIYRAASEWAIERALGGEVNEGGEADIAEWEPGPGAAGGSEAAPVGEWLLGLLRDHGPLRIGEIEARLDYAPGRRALRSELNALRGEGRIEKIGRTRGTRYRIASLVE